MAKKKMVTKVLVEHISLYDIEGDLDGLIDTLKGYKEEFEGYVNLRLDREYDYYDSPDYFSLRGDREETDAEYSARLAKNKKEREKKKLEKKEREAAEYETYLSLKEKYENE